MPNKNHIIIFAKAPVAGQCKTRLSPLLSPQQASEFYKTLILKTLKTCILMNDIDITLYITPDLKHPFFADIQDQFNIKLMQQQGSDLGERMFNALDTSSQQYKKSVLIGSDCPMIDCKYLQQAFNHLDKHDIVIGPAEDGGYVLIGATQINPHYFQAIDWGTDQVLRQTVKQLGNISYIYLNTLWDIDTPDDYQRYQKQ